ncbi:MAG: TIR domain-containing protein [Pseudomonadota bacterium]
MAWIYLIAAPEDEAHAEALSAWLKPRGHVVRPEFGQYGYPPARRGEVTLALWSRAATMSARRFLMTNRAIDAWEDERLVMAQLDHGLRPHGLADFETIDLTFEAARESRYFEVDKAIRKADGAYMQRLNVDRIVTNPPSQEAMSHKATAARLENASVSPAESEAAPNPDVFVSYAHADAEAVYPIVELVEASGRTVWIDKHGMKAGQGWAGTIVRAIKSSQMFCLMCSAASFASDHVRREVYLADKYKKALMPVRLDSANMPEDFEYFMIDRQWVDLAGVPTDQQASHVTTAFSSG